VSAGVFFVLVGAIFVYTFAVLDVNLFSEIVAFAQGFGLVSVPNTPVVRFPAPRFPNAHLPIYMAAGQFSLIWGIYQIAILAVRFVVRSPVTKKAETASNVIYWFGASYLLSLFLTETVTRSAWFEFWAALVRVLGGHPNPSRRINGHPGDNSRGCTTPAVRSARIQAIRTFSVVPGTFGKESLMGTRYRAPDVKKPLTSGVSLPPTRLPQTGYPAV
jgi:hypothetical protein